MSSPEDKIRRIAETKEKILDDIKRARTFLHSASALCGGYAMWIVPCKDISAVETKLVEIEASLEDPA